MAAGLLRHFAPVLARGGVREEPPADRVQRILARIEAEIARPSHPAAALELIAASKGPLFDCLRHHYSPVVAKAVALKVLNLCLGRYHFTARSQSTLSRPFGLIVDPSNACNLACPGCVHSSHAKELRVFDWGKGMLSEGRLAALFKLYGPHAIHVTFCNYGEPTVNPETPQYIRLARSYLMGTMLSTNLSLAKFDAEAYVESGLDFMVMSIDGATQPVYERFRRKGNIEYVLRNLRNLIAAKRRMGRNTPVLNWQFLAFKHNVHEIPAAMEMAEQLGVDQFTVLKPFDVSWDDPGIEPAEVESKLVAFDKNTERYLIDNWLPAHDLDDETIEREFETEWPERVGSALRRLSATDVAAPSASTCHWLYKNMAMDSGGRIVPCCSAPRPDMDLIFAQFDADTVDDPFNSPKYRLARQSFSDRAAYERGRDPFRIQPEPHCANCDWDKDTANTDREEVIQYFKAAGANLFDAQSVRMLSSW